MQDPFNGNGSKLITIYMGIGGMKFGSGVTRFPGLVYTVQDPLHNTFFTVLNSAN